MFGWKFFPGNGELYSCTAGKSQGGGWNYGRTKQSTLAPGISLQPESHLRLGKDHCFG